MEFINALKLKCCYNEKMRFGYFGYQIVLVCLNVLIIFLIQILIVILFLFSADLTLQKKSGNWSKYTLSFCKTISKLEVKVVLVEIVTVV